MTELNRTEYLLLVLSVDSQNIQGKLDQTYNLVQFYCFREKVELRGGGGRVWNEEEEKRGEGGEGRRGRRGLGSFSNSSQLFSQGCHFIRINIVESLMLCEVP